MKVVSPFSVSERLALTLDGLCRAMAARVLGGGLAEALIVLIWGRVRRVERRLLGLLERFRAGRIVVRGARPAPVAGRGRRGGVVRLPCRFGWLLPLVPQHAAGFGSQLRALLEEPEMREMLASVPQARRILAPVCRMLGIEGEVLGVVVSRVVRRVRVRLESGLERGVVPVGVVAGSGRRGFVALG